VRWPPSPPSCPVARAQLQHTCAAHPAEVQVWHGAPLLRAAGCFQCVSGVSTFLGILVRTRNCNGSQCADPRAHKQTAMVRNQLTPKCNRSNRCSFTKTPPQVGFPSVINCWILCQYGTESVFFDGKNLDFCRIGSKPFLWRILKTGERPKFRIRGGGGGHFLSEFDEHE